MPVYPPFVLKQQLFVRPMRNPHDIDILEFRTGLPPVAMRQNMMPPDFAARFDFATRRHRPVKKRIEPSNPHSTGRWFDVFQKS